MSGQPEVAGPINIPSKPRTRTPLPRFSNEMAKDRLHRNPQLRNTSRSPNVVNRSNERDYSYSRSPSTSHSPSPEDNERINQLIAADIRDVETMTEDYRRQTRNELLNRSQNRRRKSQSSEENQSISWYTLVFAIVSILVILVGIWLFFSYNSNSIATGEYREKPKEKEILKNVKDDLRQLKKKFRNQEEKIWEDIYLGIMEAISNPTKPWIFVLFADSNDPMICLATMIGELGRKALGTEKSLILKPAQFEDDTGNVIDNLRLKIPKRKAVIFWDLLSINNAALKAFHNLCDRENPLVKEAIYIITVKAEGYNNRLQTPLEFIENQLRSNLTGRIDEDSIMPLVIRITDGPIISVAPESNIQCPFKNTMFL